MFARKDEAKKSTTKWFKFLIGKIQEEELKVRSNPETEIKD